MLYVLPLRAIFTLYCSSISCSLKLQTQKNPETILDICLLKVDFWVTQQHRFLCAIWVGGFLFWLVEEDDNFFTLVQLSAVEHLYPRTSTINIKPVGTDA